MRRSKVFLIIALPFLLSTFTGCLTFRKSDQTILRSLKKEGMDVEIHYAPEDTLRWLWYKNEDPKAPLLLFIHGAPGSSSTFLSYLTNERLRDSFSMILVDRPGYGYSEYGAYHPIPLQYEAIKGIVEFTGVDENIVTIGHSFGGTISGYIAIQNPDWLDGTIMIAPAIDPHHEKYLWFGKLALYKSTRWMAPRSLRVAADEKYSHEEELATFLGDWHRINKPILHIHGEKDRLVPFENVSFSKNNISEKWLEVKSLQGKGHLIPFTEEEKIIHEIIGFVSKLTGTEPR